MPLSHGVAVAISVAIAYLFVTAGHVIVGEQAPKIMAITHPETVAKWSSRPLEWFRVGLLSGDLGPEHRRQLVVLRRILRVDVDTDNEDDHRRPSCGCWSSTASVGANLDPGEVGMLKGVFNLHEQQARQVMTPTPALVTVDSDDTVETGLRRCIESGHTRLVVVEDGNPDRVKGIVHANRLAQALMSEGADAPLAPLVREALIMPETKPLDDLLTDMRRQRSSLAVIVDEFGRTVGIVTIEDIIEEIVGEITDETDPVLSSIRKLVNGDWFVRGHVSLDDLADAGLDLHVGLRRLHDRRRLRVRRARPAAQARRHDQQERLLDPGRVGAGEPRRGGPHPSPTAGPEETPAAEPARLARRAPFASVREPL